jgi:hypothetical protein
MANGIGRPRQYGHHIIDTDVPSHGAGALGSVQEFGQHINQRHQDGRIPKLQFDAVTTKRFDEITLESTFPSQGVHEGREGMPGIWIVRQFLSHRDQLLHTVEHDRLEESLFGREMPIDRPGSYARAAGNLVQ